MNFFYRVREHQENGRRYLVYRRNLVAFGVYFALFIGFVILFFHYVTPEGGFFIAYSPAYVIVGSLWFLANFLLLWDSREIFIASRGGKKTIQRGKIFSISKPYELWVGDADAIKKSFPELKGQVTHGLFLDKVVQKKDNNTYNVLYTRPLGYIIFICAWAIGMLVGVTNYLESTIGVIIFLICWIIGFGAGIRGFIEFFPIVTAKFTGNEVITVGGNPFFHYPFQKIQYWIKKNK